MSWNIEKLTKRDELPEIHIRSNEAWGGISIINESCFVTADNNIDDANVSCQPNEIRLSKQEIIELFNALSEYVSGELLKRFNGNSD